MIPMCYPSDHYNGQFIPNWAMWFVLELEEYAARSGDRQLVDALRPRVLRLLDFFKQFENSDGLLEKLPSWVFVEWSKANSFVQDVNYPSNMLYSGVLDAAGRLYRLPELEAKAEGVRQAVRRQSFDGEFFVDNAVRKDGRLQVTANRTESASILRSSSTSPRPSRTPGFGKRWSPISARSGSGRMLFRRSIRRTLSLATSSVSSCSRAMGATSRFSTRRSATALHGRADGHALGIRRAARQLQPRLRLARRRVLIRDVLGLWRVDTIGKSLELRFARLELDWCKGSIPTPDGPIAVQWKKAGDQFAYRLDAPSGYRVAVQNHTGKTLVPLGSASAP